MKKNKTKVQKRYVCVRIVSRGSNLISHWLLVSWSRMWRNGFKAMLLLFARFNLTGIDRAMRALTGPASGVGSSAKHRILPGPTPSYMMAP